MELVLTLRVNVLFNNSPGISFFLQGLSIIWCNMLVCPNFCHAQLHEEVINSVPGSSAK